MTDILDIFDQPPSDLKAIGDTYRAAQQTRRDLQAERIRVAMTPPPPTPVAIQLALTETTCTACKSVHVNPTDRFYVHFTRPAHYYGTLRVCDTLNQWKLTSPEDLPSGWATLPREIRHEPRQCSICHICWGDGYIAAAVAA